MYLDKYYGRSMSRFVVILGHKTLQNLALSALPDGNFIVQNRHCLRK